MILKRIGWNLSERSEIFKFHEVSFTIHKRNVKIRHRTISNRAEHDEELEVELEVEFEVELEVEFEVEVEEGLEVDVKTEPFYGMSLRPRIV